jgi:uncharacterized Zn-finger protein
MAFGAASPTPETGTIETVTVDDRVVACDGSAGPLGHPRVWLRIVGGRSRTLTRRWTRKPPVRRHT